MAQEQSFGAGEPVIVAATRVGPGPLRRRAPLVGILAAVVAVLLVVPEQPTSSIGHAGGGSRASSVSRPSSVSVPPGVTPPTGAYATGITVGGVKCGPGVRQVPWSAYAPPCQPAWHGNNGGATTRGVTKTTITIDYRSASTAQLKELYALVPAKVVGTNAEEIATMQAYINAFNKSYELYGRKVVLVPFQGKGDFISEDIGQGQAQAQEDAVTAATSVKAFADMSLVDSSAVYATDLANQHVVTFGLYENPASWFAQYAPYEYSPGPNCTKAAVATAAILGKQMAGLPASFAGSPSLQHQTRTFGLIYPQNPQAATCAQEDVADLASYGVKVKTQVGIKFSLSGLIASADNAVAQLKAAGVTTVIMSSADPITPTFVMMAANAQNYHPEWWFQAYFGGGETNTDAFTSLFPADQAAHIIGVGNPALPLAKEEAYAAFKLGSTTPSATPIPSFFFTYESMLELFDALQLAGPDLTPQTFRAAMQGIPASAPGGMLGGWNGAQGPYDPASSYQVVWYDPTATSALNGQTGAFVACDRGSAFSYAKHGADVPAHTQLVCGPGSASTGKAKASAARATGPPGSDTVLDQAAGTGTSAPIGSSGAGFGLGPRRI